MPSPSSRVRFGVFEFDPVTGDLWKAGRAVRLQDQARQVLEALVARPGELVTREQLRLLLWPADTFVDFEAGLNVVVNKLRQALDDSATAPRFIETLPRRGYRFVAPVAPPSVAPESATRSGRAWRWSAMAGGVALAAAAVAWVPYRAIDAGPSGARVSTLAVLPLESRSADRSEEYFASGITEALTTELGSISGVNVISAQSTRQYRNSTKSISAIAKELGGVDIVLRGAVQREGGRVRLDAELVDAGSNRTLWKNAFDHDLSDSPRQQCEAAHAIARAIEIVLTPGDRARLSGARAVAPAAYDAYLRGRYYLRGTAESAEATDRALAEFERAIEIDPSYAPAWASIAEAHQLRGTFLLGRPPLDERTAAYEAASRALELDRDLAEAYAIRARVRLSEFDWAGAEEDFRQLFARSPGNPSSLVWYSYSLLLRGKFEDAVTVARRAEAQARLDLNTKVRVGFVLGLAGENDEAIERYREVLALDPKHLMAIQFLAAKLSLLGYTDEAIALGNRAFRIHGPLPIVLSGLAAYHGRAGHRAESLKYIDELLAMRRREYVAPGTLALAYAGLGDRDRAFEWLEQAYEERSNMMMHFPIESIWEWPGDPRYLGMVARVLQQHQVRGQELVAWKD